MLGRVPDLPTFGFFGPAGIFRGEVSLKKVGMLKDHFGLTKTPPKLLSDEVRSKICFYKQILRSFFFGMTFS